MLPRRYTSEAIVLSRKNYSEADRLLVVYSKDYGKLTLLAKGVRRPMSRKRGAIEIFSYIAFAGVRAKGFDIMIEAEAKDTFQSLRKSIRKMSVAYFMIETVSRLSQEEPNRELFNLIVSYLDTLSRSNRLQDVRHAFIKECLVLLGFWPAGQSMPDPDSVLESVTEREMVTKRVGMKIM